MSELLREAIHGFVGKRIHDDLTALIGSMNAATIRCVRDGTKPYEEARYKAGVADGVQHALNLIMELGQTPDA